MENEHLRFYIQTRTKLGLDAITIHKELTTAWGSKVLSYSTVQKWSKLFRDGRMEVEDDPRSGRPVTRVTEENIDLVRQIIDDDPHSTY